MENIPVIITEALNERSSTRIIEDSSRCVSKSILSMSYTTLSMFKNFGNDHKIAVVTTVTVAVAVKLHNVWKTRQLRKKWNSAGRDVVVLHAFSRSSHCPNLSPFVVKLETYLRMANIEYEFDDAQPLGSKGKTPWISLNGKDYTDSQLIMEFLGKKFNKDFSRNLNREQKAVARSMLIMADEHILWGIVWWRFIKDQGHSLCTSMRLSFLKYLFLKYIYVQKIKNMLWIQGVGRHNEEEFIEIIRKDTEALSNYLGEKKFLMGDIPCEVDCAVFGILAQMIWETPGSVFEAMIKNDYPNLLQYCLRMKEKFWPDWEKCLLH